MHSLHSPSIATPHLPLHQRQAIISGQLYTFASSRSGFVVQFLNSSCGLLQCHIHISSSKSYAGLPLCTETTAVVGRHLQRGQARRSGYGGNHFFSTAAATQDGSRNIPEAELGDKGALMTFEGQDLNDIGALKEALLASQSRAAAAESERAEALIALARAEARQQEYASSLVQSTESAMQEIQAAKASFNTELQNMIEQKLAVETELVLAKQDAIKLALSVEKMANSVLEEANAHLAEEIQLKIAAAETSAAEAAAAVEGRIQTDALDTANAVLKDMKDAIEKSFSALEAAKDKAYKSEIALFQRVQILDDTVLNEASTLGLQEAVSTLQRQLETAKSEVNQIRAELKAVLARAEAAEARAAAADEALIQVQQIGDRRAQEQEESARKALEALKVAGAARLEAARSAFKADLEAIQAAVNILQKAEKLQEQAYLQRCQALERSLVGAETLAKAWKDRALVIEELLHKSSKGVDDIKGTGGIHDILTDGRMETLLGTDSRKWDLLANGPRRETPDWMIRRIEVALQGLPPREPGQVHEENDVRLKLPTPEEVWCIASAPVKEDLYTKQAAEKEVIDEQRRVLEKTLTKKTVRRPQKISAETAVKPESGTGSGREIVFQGFNWESWRKKWYLDLEPKAADLSSCGITTIWLPPPTQSVSPQGYMPGDLYNLNSAYGTEEELKHCIEEMHNHDLLVLGDAVLNHRCAQHKGPNGVWNVYGGKLAWGPEAIVRDDPNFQGRGNPSSGDFFHAAPNIDHSQDFVRRDIVEWMKWLRSEIGYDGWRLDFVRGFWGGYVKEYIEATIPAFSIGEYWDSLAYEGGNVCYNQDSHRQRIVNWVNATGGTSSAFDVTTKGILHAALHNQYWRLIDPQGKPPGVMGWWPSRAVTFLENHDTGSTQGHWPFPRDKLMQGYAYILTHPGTPVIFYDHFYDFGLRDQIAELIAVRTRTGVHCRSPVKIYQANTEGYTAQIGDNLVIKLGRLDWNPSKQNNLVGDWQRCVDKGADYQIWERK